MRRRSNKNSLQTSAIVSPAGSQRKRERERRRGFVIGLSVRLSGKQVTVSYLQLLFNCLRYYIYSIELYTEIYIHTHR